MRESLFHSTLPLEPNGVKVIHNSSSSIPIHTAFIPLNSVNILQIVTNINTQSKRTTGNRTHTYGTSFSETYIGQTH